MEIDSLSVETCSSNQHSQSEDTWTKTIGPETMSDQPIGDKNSGETESHVTDGGRHQGSSQSLTEELMNVLPIWKRQIYANRVIKEKAREKAEREKVGSQRNLF